MRETWVWSLGRKDPLEKEMATHSSTLAWKTPWREKPGRLQSMGSQRAGHDQATSLSPHWWRVHLSIQGTRDWPLVWEDATCSRATKPMCHNYWACAPETVHSNYWALELQPLKPKHPRAYAPQEKPPLWKVRAVQQKRSLHTTTREQFPLTATREKPMQQQRPRTTNKYMYF